MAGGGAQPPVALAAERPGRYSLGGEQPGRGREVPSADGSNNAAISRRVVSTE